jgi:hypothetical protein
VTSKKRKCVESSAGATSNNDGRRGVRDGADTDTNTRVPTATATTNDIDIKSEAAAGAACRDDTKSIMAPSEHSEDCVRRERKDEEEEQQQEENVPQPYKRIKFSNKGENLGKRRR